MFTLAALLVFLSVAFAGYALAGFLTDREKARQTIQRRLGAMSGRSEERRASIFKDTRFSSIAVLDRLLGRISITSALVRTIQQAGLKNRVGEVLLYIPLLASIGALVGMLFGGNPLLTLALAFVGGIIPILVVRRRRRRRTAMFSEQLPDALDLVRAALQAGHSLISAFYVVADEFPEPIAEEFRTVAEEIRLGLPLREALHNLRDRVEDPNIPILIVGILVAQEVGGNMAEVLDNTAYTVRERFKLLRDAQVMTAQGRLSGRVLTALPLLVGVLMYTLNPKYFVPMLENETGVYMVAYALCSIVLGHFAIQRMVQIRV